jgi:predicted methyltransferase
MIRSLSIAAVAAGLMLGTAHAQSVPDAVKSSVADKGRPAADTARDENRKPAEVVAFSGMKAGDVVADINPGGGYFTRIFAKTVGDKGKVYAVVSDAALAKRPEAADAVKDIAADANYGGVVELLVADFAALKTAQPLDIAWTSLNYHDFKNRGGTFTDQMNKAVFAALKSGGTYIVIDHAAEKGSGARDSEKLHRIDPELVKKEVMAAGFKLESESDLLAHAEDDHTGRVFDDAIRGKTDQFVFKFRKP